MKTVRGIYHDLRESEYTTTLYSSLGDIVVYFSSKLYQQKFVDNLAIEAIRFNQSINNVYKERFNIKADYLSMVRLYTLIEKRGFYMTINGVDINCLEDLVFDVIPNYKTK